MISSKLHGFLDFIQGDYADSKLIHEVLLLGGLDLIGELRWTELRHELDAEYVFRQETIVTQHHQFDLSLDTFLFNCCTFFILIIYDHH